MIFNKEVMLKHLDGFRTLYNERPIKNNKGGMNSSHLFPTYVYCMEAKPKLIIESGIWKGQGTWLFEKCCPTAKIVSIDITLSNLVYKSNNVLYYEQDMETLDMDSILNGYDMDDVLVFLDDHQDFDKRLDFLLEKKILHILYEDNYPSDQGDCLSVKKIMSGTDYVIDSLGKRTFHKLETTRRNEILDNIEFYEEFSPIFDNDRNRWGGDWNTYETNPPLLSCENISEYSEFYEERLGYTWIAYLKLRD